MIESIIMITIAGDRSKHFIQRFIKFIVNSQT